MENEALLRQYKEAVDVSTIFSKTDTDGIITYVNAKFCEVTGYTASELIGKPHNIIRHPDMPYEIYNQMWETIRAGRLWHGILKNRKKNGEGYYVSAVVIPVFKENGSIGEYISIRQDISESIDKDILISFYTRDSLTRLPNRQKLQSDIKSLDADAMLVLVDINEFSMLNDLYGEAIGNDILQKSARELGKLIYKDEATLYKLYSDKYAILVKEKKLFEKYLNLIRVSLEAEGENGFDLDVSDEENACIDISYTVGIAYGREELFSQSGIALKNAKMRKKSVVIYDKELNLERAQKENMARLKSFKTALQQDKIIPYFQPIIDAGTGEVVKYEAIARLINEKGMVISPMMFLDVAKESRLFEYFTRQVMQKVFHIASKNSVELSMNLTYDDIASTEFVTYVKNRLEGHRGARITFEILESEEVVNYTVIERFIEVVKASGCKIAIDDFGSGYSNFVHLVRLDADFIKIDGSIIEKIVEDKDSQTITKILVEYAAEKGLKTVAEFVSSAAIAQKAIDMGVDYLQGYYYGEPRPAEGYGLKV